MIYTSPAAGFLLIIYLSTHLDQGSANFFYKGLDNILDFMSHMVSVAKILDSTIRACSHRPYVNERTWLHSNKTLFLKKAQDQN